MTREEFEAWIEDGAHLQEAIDRLPKADRKIDKWIKALLASLQEVAIEEAENEEFSEDEDGEASEDDDDLEPDEEEDEEESED